MRTTFSSSVALLLLSFMLTACGDIFMKKSEDKKAGMSQFATCDPDPKALSKIFTENVKGELLCLGKNLNLFIDVVKTDRPGNLSYKELKIYIETNIPDIDDDVLLALSGIFDINSLIFGDDKLYINKANVGKLVNLLIDVNKAVVDNKVYDYFMAKEGKISFLEHNRRKAKIFSAFSFIAKRFKEEISDNNRKVINFVDLLGKFKNLDNNVILQNCTDLLYLKKMFLGGDEEVLTSVELKRFAGMLPDIGKVVFDLAHHDEIEHSENQSEEVILTMREDAETLVKNLYYKGQDFVNVMTLDNIFDTVKIFAPEYLKYKKYTNEILKAKEALLENSTPIFNSNEVMILAKEFLLSNLDKGAFFFRMYAVNSDVLNDGNTINTDLQGIINSGYKEEQYKEEFNRIVKRYRYFKGREFSASFNRPIERNPLGIFQVSLLEYIITKFMKAYGSVDNAAQGKFKFSQAQLEKMMLDFKDFLEGEGIIDPGRTKNTAETITLMATLFQHQSDGDADIELTELTEFSMGLLSSNSLAKMADGYFQGVCPTIDTKSGSNRYDPQCYRDEFVRMMDVEKNGVRIGAKLGKLEKYLTDQSTNVDEYLQISEVFTRDCVNFNDGSTVPMSERDLFLLFSGLMAIEQTIIKFDVNNDNVLNPNEVDKAFPIYQSAIEALLPSTLKYLAKKVFLYMIKHEKVPSKGAVVGLILTPAGALKADASRKTLAIILKALSEESPANQENPFNCDLLKGD